jgi:hypothetical protein
MFLPELSGYRARNYSNFGQWRFEDFGGWKIPIAAGKGDLFDEESQ